MVPTQVSPTMSPVKDVVQHLELVTPKSGRADVAGRSRSTTTELHSYLLTSAAL